MPPPPLQFNSIHPGLPPPQSLRNNTNNNNNNDILNHIEKMASSSKSSTLPNLNDQQNLLMNQFFRNGVIKIHNN